MDEKYMRAAIREAKKAYDKEEVPIGAVIVKDGKIIARAHNLRESSKQACAHAEILAIKEASKKINNWRLDGCKIYVTLEPCLMCTSAIFQARIDEIYVGVLRNLDSEITLSYFKDFMFENKISFKSGILHDEIKKVMDESFKKIR